MSCVDWSIPPRYSESTYLLGLTTFGSRNLQAIKTKLFIDIRGQDAPHRQPGDAAVAGAARQAHWELSLAIFGPEIISKRAIKNQSSNDHDQIRSDHDKREV